MTLVSKILVPTQAEVAYTPAYPEAKRLQGLMWITDQLLEVVTREAKLDLGTQDKVVKEAIVIQQAVILNRLVGILNKVVGILSKVVGILSSKVVGILGSKVVVILNSILKQLAAIKVIQDMVATNKADIKEAIREDIKEDKEDKEDTNNQDMVTDTANSHLDRRSPIRLPTPLNR